MISGDAQDKEGTLCSIFIGLEPVMRRKGDMRDDGCSWPVKSRHIESAILGITFFMSNLHVDCRYDDDDHDDYTVVFR